MVATANQVMHEQNFKVLEQVHICIGSDRIIRVNADGVCLLRLRMLRECELEIEDLRVKK